MGMTGENMVMGKEMEDISGQVMEATMQPSIEKKKVMGSLELLGRSLSKKCSSSISMSICTSSFLLPSFSKFDQYRLGM